MRSLSGDKLFSSRENNVRTSKRAVASSFFRTREKEEMSKPVNISSRIPRATLEQRTAKVSYRRLSAGESRGLVAVKKAKERRRRRRKKGKKKRRRAGEKNCAPLANGLRILQSLEEKRGTNVHCSLLATFKQQFSIVNAT